MTLEELKTNDYFVSIDNNTNKSLYKIESMDNTYGYNTNKHNLKVRVYDLNSLCPHIAVDINLEGFLTSYKPYNITKKVLSPKMILKLKSNEIDKIVDFLEGELLKRFNGEKLTIEYHDNIVNYDVLQEIVNIYKIHDWKVSFEYYAANKTIFTFCI